MDQPNQRQFRTLITIMGKLEIPQLNFLKTKLDYHSSKISQTEWNAYFDWYFEAILSIPLYYFCHQISLFSESLSSPLSSEFVRLCSFKIKSSKDPEAISLISYMPSTKAEL